MNNKPETLQSCMQRLETIRVERDALKAANARVPMTDIEIYNALASITEDPEPASEIIGCADWPEIVDMIRRIEAHHGIGGSK